MLKFEFLDKLVKTILWIWGLVELCTPVMYVAHIKLELSFIVQRHSIEYEKPLCAAFDILYSALHYRDNILGHGHQKIAQVLSQQTLNSNLGALNR